MALGTASTCVNHPGFHATGRCKQCGKPFCNKCLVQGATGNFCGEPCKERHEKFAERAHQMDRVPEGPSILRRVSRVSKRILVLAIVLAIVLFALDFFGMDIPVVSQFIGRFTGN